MKKLIKKLLSNKKGMAIELAMLVMLIVVGLSALLVSVSILNKKASNDLSLEIKERLVLDQIGQSFVVAVKDKTLSEWEMVIPDGYSANVSNETELSLVDSQGNVKLSIKLQAYSDGYKITEWKYS